MATTKVKLRELRNADVRYISLVDRAASRIPFRVLKRDGEADMSKGIDLMNLIRKKEVLKPEVAALVVYVQKEETLTEAVRKAIEEAGFKTDVVRKEDADTLVYAQGADTDNVCLIRLSDQMVVAVKHFVEPTGIFSAAAKEHGFYPSVEATTVLLNTAIKEMTAKQDFTAMKDVMADFEAYAQAMNQVPAACLKADAAVSVLVKKEDPYKKKSKAEEDAALAAAKEAQHNARKKDYAGMSEEQMKAKGCTKEEIDDEMKSRSAKKVEDTMTEEEMTQKGMTAEDIATEMGKRTAKKAEEDAAKKAEEEAKAKADELAKKADPLLEALKGLEARLDQKIADVTTKIETVVQTQSAQQKTLDGVAQKTETLDQSLKTIVVAMPNNEDGLRVVKQEEPQDPRTGFFDTAFMPKRARENRR